MDNIFSKRLSLLLEKHDMTQKDLSVKIGVTEATISRYFSNTVNPRMDLVNKIAKLFDVSVDYLVGNDDMMNNDNEYKELYERVYNDPDLKIFFNKTKELTKDEMKWVLSIIDQVKKEHNKE